MELAVMRFARIRLPHNPRNLKIQSKKSVKNSVLLDGRRITDKILHTPKLISGKGELYGEHCFEQFNRLQMLYADKQEEILSVPGVGAFCAVLSELSLAAEPMDGVILFSFTFTCYDGKNVSKKISEKSTYRVKQDENLWDVSYTSGVDIDKLLKLNPWIRTPWSIKEGEEVKLG